MYACVMTTKKKMYACVMTLQKHAQFEYRRKFGEEDSTDKKLRFQTLSFPCRNVSCTRPMAKLDFVFRVVNMEIRLE